VYARPDNQRYFAPGGRLSLALRVTRRSQQVVRVG
jgi:hypothetical protein